MGDWGSAVAAGGPLAEYPGSAVAVGRPLLVDWDFAEAARRLLVGDWGFAVVAGRLPVGGWGVSPEKVLGLGPWVVAAAVAKRPPLQGLERPPEEAMDWEPEGPAVVAGRPPVGDSPKQVLGWGTAGLAVERRGAQRRRLGLVELVRVVLEGPARKEQWCRINLQMDKVG